MRPATPNPNKQICNEFKVTIGAKTITLNINQDVLDNLSQNDAVTILEDAINAL